MPRRSSTAAIVVIGNEILSGKTQDDNGPFLIRELRALGTEVCRLEVVPDEVELIADAVRRCREAAAHVLTSGGIGPTHDDVTVAGVARALDRKVVHHPVLLDCLKSFWTDGLTPARLRLAEVPDGAEVVMSAALRFPLIVAENVYIFPGVPELLRAKFDAVRDRFRAAPFHLRTIFVRESETNIAQCLDRTLEAHPTVALGSYPRFDHPEWKVKLTVESRDAAAVESAVRFLVGALPAGSVVRVE